MTGARFLREVFSYLFSPVNSPNRNIMPYSTSNYSPWKLARLSWRPFRLSEIWKAFFQERHQLSRRIFGGSHPRSGTFSLSTLIEKLKIL